MRRRSRRTPCCCWSPTKQSGSSRCVEVPIITVRGLIEPEALGPTLPHEHLFCDTSPDYREPPDAIQGLMRDLGVDLEAPITLSSLGFLRRGWINLDLIWAAALIAMGVLLLLT